MRTSSIFLNLCKSLFVVTLTVLLIACGGGSGEPEVVKPKKPAVIMVFGDSTSQGYGVELFGEYYENVINHKIDSSVLNNNYLQISSDYAKTFLH